MSLITHCCSCSQAPNIYILCICLCFSSHLSVNAYVQFGVVLFWLIKAVHFYLHLCVKYTTLSQSMTEGLTTKRIIEITAEFSTLAQKGLSFLDYSLNFFRLAQQTTFNDETLKSLFWIRANYHRPVDGRPPRHQRIYMEGGQSEMSGERLPPESFTRQACRAQSPANHHPTPRRRQDQRPPQTESFRPPRRKSLC